MTNDEIKALFQQTSQRDLRVEIRLFERRRINEGHPWSDLVLLKQIALTGAGFKMEGMTTGMTVTAAGTPEVQPFDLPITGKPS